MKNLFFLVGFFFMIHLSSSTEAQNTSDESIGLPGDNLNLFAVMKLFQESGTMELFEKNLNDEKSRINNLDLNGDGQIDYITVIDNFDGKTHTIILRDAISAEENQDVAVFYVNKEPNSRVQIQLVGDESLYGKDFIVEPNDISCIKNGHNAFSGNSGYRRIVKESPVLMETSVWPLLSLLFLPSYAVWHSSYSYGYYPSYWRPWQPLYWHSYSRYHSNMNNYYRWNFRRSSQYNDPRFREHYFLRQRDFAPTVSRYRNEGFYKRTYSHPELRRDGLDQFNRPHTGNLNRESFRSDGQLRKDNRYSIGSGNKPPVNHDNPSSNRFGVTGNRSISDQKHDKSSGKQLFSTQGVIIPSTSHNNQSRDYGRKTENPGSLRPSDAKPLFNHGNQTQISERHSVNQNITRQSAPRIVDNQNNPTDRQQRNQRNTNSQSHRSVESEPKQQSARPSAQHSGNQVRSDSRYKTIIDQKPTGIQPGRPNIVPSRKDNTPK